MPEGHPDHGGLIHALRSGTRSVCGWANTLDLTAAREVDTMPPSRVCRDCYPPIQIDEMRTAAEAITEDGLRPDAPRRLVDAREYFLARARTHERAGEELVAQEWQELAAGLTAYLAADGPVDDEPVMFDFESE